MENEVDMLKLILQVNSLAIANSIYLYLIYIDDYQKDMGIQWFVLGCDLCFLFGIYGSDSLAIFSMLVVATRYIVVIIWASIVYRKTDLNINPELEISLNIVAFMLIDACVLFPLQGIRLGYQSARTEMKERFSSKNTGEEPLMDGKTEEMQR